MRRWVIVLALLAGTPAPADITSARYAEPTTRYDHAILGDGIEHGALVLQAGNRRLVFRLPDSRVFEDTAPRLADLDGDGDPEVIVVETDIAKGAQLAIYDETGKIASTPYIGRTHRWLAPIGAADLDGDGRIEVAYIDRPHLARLLRVWRLHEGALVLVAELSGLTNHRIGDRTIAGGIRDCGQGPQMITASGDWGRVMGITLSDGTLRAKDLGAHQSDTMQRILACKR